MAVDGGERTNHQEAGLERGGAGHERRACLGLAWARSDGLPWGTRWEDQGREVEVEMACWELWGDERQRREEMAKDLTVTQECRVSKRPREELPRGAWGWQVPEEEELTREVACAGRVARL